MYDLYTWENKRFVLSCLTTKILVIQHFMGISKISSDVEIHYDRDVKVSENRPYFHIYYLQDKTLQVAIINHLHINRGIDNVQFECRQQFKSGLTLYQTTKFWT